MKTCRMVPHYGINRHLKGTRETWSIIFGTLDPNKIVPFGFVGLVFEIGASNEGFGP